MQTIYEYNLLMYTLLKVTLFTTTRYICFCLHLNKEYLNAHNPVTRNAINK